MAKLSFITKIQKNLPDIEYSQISPKKVESKSLEELESMLILA